MPERAVPSRRRGVDLLIAIVGILAILWIGYWYLANQLTGLAVQYALHALERGGRTADCVAARAEPSPLRLDVGCSAVTFADPAKGLTLDLAGLSLGARLYRPLHVDAGVTGPLALTTASGGATAEWSAADLRADAGLSGPKRIAFSLREAALTGDLLARLDLTRMTMPALDVTIEPGANGTYVLAAATEGVRPADASGRDLPEIALRLKMAANQFGSALGFNPRRTLQKWIAKGGDANLEELSLRAGDFEATAEGKLTVSLEGLVSGKVNLRIKGLAALPDLAEAYRPGTRERAEKARKILTAVTRDAKAPEGDVRTTTLTLRNGVVAYGLLPLMVIPPLF